MNLDVPKIFNRVIDPKKNPDKTRNIMDLFDSILFNEVGLIFLSRNIFILKYKTYMYF